MRDSHDIPHDLERKDASAVLLEAKKAVDEIGVGFEEFKKANDENLAKRDVILDEKLAKIEADLQQAQKVTEEAVLAAKRQIRVVTDQDGNEINMDAKAHEWAELAAKRRGETTPDFKHDDLVAYQKGLNRWMRKGEQMLSNDEVKALSVGSDPNGGYTVHPDMTGRMTQRIFETSPIRAFASVQVIGTDAIEGSFDNDEAGSGWVAERGARTETNTPQLGVWRIPAHELYAMPKATQRLLDDSNVNIEEWHADKVTAKFARDENTAMVTGNGVGKPRGFLTFEDYATPGVFENGKIEQFDTGASGAFAAAPNSGDVLLDALYGLKDSYRANANWFLNRSTTGAIRKLKDSDGAYIWQPGAAAGQPATIFGHGMASFEDMPSLAANSLSIAIGDMRAAYQIVDRQGVRILRDPLTDKPFILFYTTKRVGGDVVNFEALKVVRFGT